MHPSIETDHENSGEEARREFLAASGAPLFLVDWRNFIFLHFALRPDDLAPHVPFALDVRDGRAFVSLVFFTFERLRPARWLWPSIGRALFRPISDHSFLNVRTYVRGPDGPGIHFLAEWVDNPLSLRLGPLSYGLPYRFGKFRRIERSDGGLTQVFLHDKSIGAGLNITVPMRPDHAPRECERGSPAEFLLERYTAYTQRDDTQRSFRIWHSPWQASRIELARFDTALVEKVFPWFGKTEFIAAHLSPGVRDVWMSGPRLCAREDAVLATARATSGQPISAGPGAPEAVIH